MPIYEYQCKKCHHRFEELVLDRSEKITCPKCKDKKTEKLISNFSAKSCNGNFSTNSGGSCGPCSSGNCSSCH